MASDAAKYEVGSTSFETPKMLQFGQNYLITFIGTPEYFKNLDFGIFERKEMTDVMLGLRDHCLSIRDTVIESLRSLEDEEDRKANFCLFLLGCSDGVPTLCQLNSFEDFKYNVLFSEGELVFSNIYYGDEMKPWKNNTFIESHKYMTKLGKEYEHPSPGIVGEILTRGIYHKADEEAKLSKKYAGGPVTVVMMDKKGVVTPLTNLII